MYAERGFFAGLGSHRAGQASLDSTGRPRLEIRARVAGVWGLKAAHSSRSSVFPRGGSISFSLRRTSVFALKASRGLHEAHPHGRGNPPRSKSADGNIHPIQKVPSQQQLV